MFIDASPSPPQHQHREHRQNDQAVAPQPRQGADGKQNETVNTHFCETSCRLTEQHGNECRKPRNCDQAEARGVDQPTMDRVADSI